MMKKKMMRLLAAMLAMLLLVGCGAKEDDSLASQVDTEPMENLFTFATLPTVGINDWNDEVPTEPGETLDPEEEPLLPVESYTLESGAKVIENAADPVQYVMIYNPEVYDPNYPALNASLSTGSLGLQVAVDLNRGTAGEETTFSEISQGQLNADVPVEELAGKGGSRAPAMVTPFQVGDVKTFYCYGEDSMNSGRITRDFTCRYAGTYCNLWVAGVDMSDELVNQYATQFDTYIYESVVETFGESRFAKFGGKVNLLYYPLPEGYMGCFCMLDLFAADEATPMEVQQYGINTGLDILHINGNYALYPQMETDMNSTLAHEFQHLICATNAFQTLTFTQCDVWLNEAMSGYIEELLYPGVKAGEYGHIFALTVSDQVRNGQSLYNFESDAYDCGVYGNVYLYAEYLARIAGDDVFSNLHNYWRSSFSPTLCTAEALANSVPMEVYTAVNNSFAYPSDVMFASEEEEFMSKLSLLFYLELLDLEQTDPVNFDSFDKSLLLYNQISAANIEGGGRIIIALEGDSFTIPTDADPGLIYVGLNENFEVVTPLIYN